VLLHKEADKTFVQSPFHSFIQTSHGHQL